MHVPSPEKRTAETHTTRTNPLFGEQHVANAMNEIRFVDTTLRDGPQSLWSLKMRTDMMLPVAEILDNAGFKAIEIMASPEFKKCVRDLKEDPWERLRMVRCRIAKTPLRFIRGRYNNAFQIEPDALVDLWTERLAANGIDELRISDSSNTVDGWRKQTKAVQSFGMDVIINLIYSLSPKHTDEYYAEKTRQAAALRPKALCLKDPGALITPERVRTLVPIVLINAGDIPVEFHTHCVTGLGALCTLEAIKLGIKCVNTAIPPLAEGSSNPSTFTIATNARALGYAPTIDESSLHEVERHFTAIAEREDLPIGRPAAYDYSQYVHQVPGGMISNFHFQLSKVGMADRLPEVLEETARVRAELGYPIMVTPYSQFVGTQAALNVITGGRYKTITDEVIHYALGWWGEEEGACIDPNIRDMILSSPRAKELARQKPEQITLKEIRQRYGGPGVSDDEMLLRIANDKKSVDAMRAAPASSSYGAPDALIELIERLGAYKGYRQMRLEKNGLSMIIGRNGMR
jgi:oxaloacetate decarboxylase alpha subunit